MKVICISGKAQHGKDTVADMIKDELQSKGKRVLIAHYAGLLKYIAHTFFDWDGKKDEQGRTILQYIGTDVIRKKMPDMWVGFIINILTLFPNEWDYILIPDTRFPNEIEALRQAELDAILMRIIRGGYDNGLTEEQSNHPSEIALDGYNYDYIMNNKSSLQDLRNEVNSFVEEVLSV